MEKRGFWLTILLILGIAIFVPAIDDTIDGMISMDTPSKVGPSVSFQKAGVNAQSPAHDMCDYTIPELGDYCENGNGVCDGQRKVCRVTGGPYGYYPLECTAYDYGFNNNDYEDGHELTCDDGLDNDCDGSYDFPSLSNNPDVEDCQEGPSGNVELIDVDGFTILNTFDTIQECSDVVMAGQTCLVYEGVYNERINIRNLGSTFKAEPRRSVTVDGGFNIIADNGRVEGFKITRTEFDKASGVNIVGDYAEVIDNYIYDVTWYAINGQDHSTSYAYIANNEIFHTQLGVRLMGDNWIVENNDMSRLYNYYEDTDTDYFRFFGDYHLIKGNYLHGVLSYEKGGHTDCFQTQDGSGGARHIIIEDNICYGYVAQGYMVSGVLSEDITIRNNVFAHASAWGIRVRGGHKDIKVYNNIIADVYNKGAGIGFAQDAEGIVKNNIIYSMFSGGNTGNSVTISDNAIVDGDYNLIYGANDPQPGAGGSNDIIGFDPELVNVPLAYVPISNVTQTFTSVEIPIDYESFVQQGDYLEILNDGVLRTVTQKYQKNQDYYVLEFTPSYDHIFYKDHFSVALWGTNSNIEEDFHLKQGSMAIDNGESLPVYYDIDGDDRPYPMNGDWDIGADEYVG
jgi:hypothetical protein